MRPAFYSDASAAARVLLSVPHASRRKCAAKMIKKAMKADQFVRRYERLHPKWGNGTLRSVALTCNPTNEPSFDNSDYCQCFEEVLRQLRKVRARAVM
ncbi:hypothetical protein Z946_324 [Sulfitobacter noctilucicola]|uniref:DUF7742 domain-containing protein n=1 Tax=Sulfitobacter noctilucicola TaxID=1342301 RepID=A0A7W6MAV3_9RHOB|nr:hypothetical protein Z946_324 [Sulfitobacter noctilucicola]MBB4175663.1 hypothetical protein [Sulfitobacter noctilucicola]